MTEYPHTQKGLFANALAWVLAAIIAGGVIAIALWAFGVFTADAKGRGELHKQNVSAVNRIQKQEMFEQLYADINGYTGKIAVAAQTYADEKTDVNRTNLAGVEQECIDTVQQYDAEARKVTSRDWRSADLPDQSLDYRDFCVVKETP